MIMDDISGSGKYFLKSKFTALLLACWKSLEIGYVEGRKNVNFFISRSPNAFKFYGKSITTENPKTL